MHIPLANKKRPTKDRKKSIHLSRSPAGSARNRRCIDNWIANNKETKGDKAEKTADSRVKDWYQDESPKKWPGRRPSISLSYPSSLKSGKLNKIVNFSVNLSLSRFLVGIWRHLSKYLLLRRHVDQFNLFLVAICQYRDLHKTIKSLHSRQLAPCPRQSASSTGSVDS